MKKLTEHPYFQYFCVAVVAGYVLFLQFYHLGELPIVQWDESRLAVNAAEMSQSNNFLISTFENKAGTKSKLAAVGADYALSKRTAVYARYESIDDKAGAIAAATTIDGAGTKRTRTAVGVRHAF